MLNEKSEFSKIRKFQLSRLDNADRILEIEKKFGQYTYIPLQIPKFELKDIEKFQSWWFTHAELATRKRDSIDGELHTGHQLFSNFLTVGIHPPVEQFIRNENYREDFFLEFPEIRDQIFEYFPINKIEFCLMWSSIRHISPHRDHFNFIDLPLSFRSLLYDENPKPTLYYKECLPNEILNYGQEVQYVEKFEDTNSWCWNNLRVKHGSDYNPMHKKIIIVVEGLKDINWDKYECLLEKSISAYEKHLSISNQKIKDFINLEV
jgi:hypothetical protein